MTRPAEAAPTSDRELVLTRIINAPREKVFRAWTDPQLLSSGRPCALDHTRRGT